MSTHATLTLGRTDACRCAACASHRRPQDVPWHQHAVGCSIRQAELATAAPGGWSTKRTRAKLANL